MAFSDPQRAREYAREWRAKNPGYLKQYRAANPDKYEAEKRRQREHYHETIDEQRVRYKRTLPRHRERARFKRYGLTSEDFDSMLAAQGGGCAVCGCTSPGAKGWHVDHVHVEGYDELPPEERRRLVRGILCHWHNLMLGNAHDNPSELEAGAAYLRKHAKD